MTTSSTEEALFPTIAIDWVGTLVFPYSAGV